MNTGKLMATLRSLGVLKTAKKETVTVQQIWRYPVKSMQGESLSESNITWSGVDGDHVYALEAAYGRIASAKHPERFGKLLECYARIEDGEVAVELPAGSAPPEDYNASLTELLGEPVQVVSDPPEHAVMDYMDLDGQVLAVELREGTFFDVLPIYIITTAEIAALQELLPNSLIDVRRFRPSLVLESESLQPLLGKTMQIGEAEILIHQACTRCIMTTLPQPDLPKDEEILRTIQKEWDGKFGVLGIATKDGYVKVGDVCAPID